ncbi:Cullin-3B [Lathyrus oleraceus]|nr:Cullin-3B [Pisum sativum]
MSNQRKRNFQIEAFKHRVIMDPRYAEHTWKILEHAIHEIYDKNASSLSFEELYRFNADNFSFRLCSHPLFQVSVSDSSRYSQRSLNPPNTTA